MPFSDWFRTGNKKYDKRMKKLFTCRVCKKGDLIQDKGYFECPVCGHEYKEGGRQGKYLGGGE